MRYTSKKRVREPEDPDEVGDTHEDGWWKSHRGGRSNGEEVANELQLLFAQFLGYMDLEKEMVGRETDVGVRNHILSELVDKYCTVAATGASCDDAFNAIAHKIQKNRGLFFVHKTQDNTIITNAQGILWSITPLTENLRVTPNGDATECKIPVKYMDMVEEYVLTSVSHQIEMVEKNLRMACPIGRQDNCVKDLERMNEASVKSHDTEDQEVFMAWDDVSGARLNPELVKEARKAEMEYFRKMGVYTKVSKKRCYDVTEKAPIGGQMG